MVEEQHIHPFSEQHFRLATKFAKVGLWEWDLLQRQPTWSTTGKAILGYPPESDLRYEDVLARVHPADYQRVKLMLSESLSNGTAYNAEYRVIWPDGSLHWIAAGGQGVVDENGKVLRLIGVILDITAQKQAEEIERAVGLQIQTILESVTDGLGHTDRAGRLTYVNTAVERMSNVPREQALGRTLWEAYPAFVESSVEQCYRQVMQTRQPAQCEFYNPHLQTWAAFHLYPAEDGGITVLIQDNTRQKSLAHGRDRLLTNERTARIEAETARQRSDDLVALLEQKQAFFQTVLSQAPCGIFIAEAPGGKVFIANKEASKTLGHRLIQCNTVDEYAQYHALHDDGRPYLAEEYPLARALNGEVIMQEHSLYRQGDGTIIHLSSSAAPVRDATGRILASVTTFYDVSERYELERKKDEFIVMASHELRTPLTSLKGSLQLLERRLQRLFQENDSLITLEGRVLSELDTFCLKPALRQVNVESRLINDLLDATSIRSETLSVVLEPCNLARIVVDAVDDLRVVAGCHPIYLELPEQFEIAVMADHVRIEQVITNLVTNALKYSGETQPVTVGISLKEGEAQVWVKDLGPGLSPEAQQQIWDRFSPLSRFTAYKSRGGGGLGLGLYISQALVRAHGGRMGVESEPGEGSTFWFTLPLKHL